MSDIYLSVLLNWLKMYSCDHIKSIRYDLNTTKLWYFIKCACNFLESKYIESKRVLEELCSQLLGHKIWAKNNLKRVKISIFLLRWIYHDSNYWTQFAFLVRERKSHQRAKERKRDHIIKVWILYLFCISCLRFTSSSQIRAAQPIIPIS